MECIHIAVSTWPLLWLMCFLAAHLVLCLHPVSGLLLSFFYIASLWLQRFLWGGRKRENICSTFLFVYVVKSLEKLTNNIVASRFFARTPSRIRRIVKICDVVNRFLRKPFWFFLKISSILVLYSCVAEHCACWAAMDIRVIPRLFIGYSKVTGYCVLFI